MVVSYHALCMVATLPKGLLWPLIFELSFILLMHYLTILTLPSLLQNPAGLSFQSKLCMDQSSLAMAAPSLNWSELSTLDQCSTSSVALECYSAIYQQDCSCLGSLLPSVSTNEVCCISVPCNARLYKACALPNASKAILGLIMEKSRTKNLLVSYQSQTLSAVC